MAKQSWFGKFIGGKFLVQNGGLAKRWVFVIYIFALIIIYITLRFMMKETLVTEVRNQEIIKDLKAEYSEKKSKLLYLSKRGEVERMLKEKNSTLSAPTLPPKTIKYTD